MSLSSIQESVIRDAKRNLGFIHKRAAQDPCAGHSPLRYWEAIESARCGLRYAHVPRSFNYFGLSHRVGCQFIDHPWVVKLGRKVVELVAEPYGLYGTDDDIHRDCEELGLWFKYVPKRAIYWPGHTLTISVAPKDYEPPASRLSDSEFRRIRRDLEKLVEDHMLIGFAEIKQQWREKEWEAARRARKQAEDAA